MEKSKINTYLGQKGYTIPKNEISIEKQNQIKKDLMVRPYTPGAPGNGGDTTFPAYRESSNKLYVPHYYGVEQFGAPKEIKISEGTDINLEFNGQLRDYQIPVIEKYIKYIEKVKYGGGLLELPCAWGKTSGSLNILSRLKKKTIVIVHKEFLMNQWIERIQQFLPEARIGKIQGNIIDVENKDIVLCMLQSLINKNYPESLFSEFGLTIIDEVHHISSQTFSNSLFKVVTKYMLGLSATMNRKDGTTKVFKMFLGDVIHKVERKDEVEVEVRAITYKVNDDDFNDTILDYKGQPQNSSMISKLCEYNRRTEFIIEVLNDFICVENIDKEIIKQHKLNMDKANPCCEICNKNNNYLLKNTCCNIVKYCMPCLNSIELAAETNIKHFIGPDGEKKSSKERPKCPNCKKVLKYEQYYIKNLYVKPLEERHTIVMAQNLNILHYIYKKIVCKNLASVGYYIGGMSESELKRSDKQQIVLASYSLCSEGLDIPTLNAEFLITPKTDIVQCVGRILRAKHATQHPIIYDFIDSHDVFQRQWLKRKSYYKKQNYKIIGTDSYEYNLDTTKWNIIFKPGCKKNIQLNTEKSDDDDEKEENNKNFVGKCFIKIKKIEI